MTKIIDIIPPNTSKNNSVKIVKKEKQKKNGKISKIVFSMMAFALVGFGFIFFMEGKGNVVIYPLTQDVAFENSIQIMAEEADIDFENNVIPGEYFEERLDFESTYDSTGSDETATKAKGVITVCNEHSSGKPLKLVKNTRFLSAEGELTYRAVSAFSVPKKTGNNPGCVEVSVVAEDVGDAYNINSGTFSVPGLKNTEYYTAIWGELRGEQKIKGGSVSEQRVVTEKDIDKAKDLFKEKYLEEAKQSLVNNLEEVGTYVYFDNGFKQDFDKFIVLASEGDKIESFKIEATITTRVLIFRKADIDKYIEKKLLLKEEGRDIVPESLSKEFKDPEEEAENNSLILKVSAKTYPKIREIFILNDIKGQDIEDCKNILKDLPDIRSADVSASLFWKDKLPKNKDNIDIQINFGE